MLLEEVGSIFGKVDDLSLAKDIPQACPNFANYVLKNLQAHANSSNVKQEPCLYVSHMLTRFAYQALGMQDELPKAITQS